MHTKLRLWRSHPVLFAALIGAAVGIANVIAIEFGGLFKENSNAVLRMLMPSSRFSSGVSESGAMQAALIMFIEVAGNVLVYAALFAAPVALIVAIRRAFKRSPRQ